MVAVKVEPKRRGGSKKDGRGRRNISGLLNALLRNRTCPKKRGKKGKKGKFPK